MPNYPYTFQLPPLNVQDIPNDGVAGEFLGINGSGVLDWLTAGGGGTGDMLKADNLLGLASYPTARTNLGLGTGDSPTFKNLVISAGTLTSDAPVTISQTWNAGSNVMTALKVVATDTASGGTSSLVDAQTTAGGSQFSVRKGVIVGNNYSSSTTYGVKTAFVSFGNYYGSGALCGSVNGLTLFAAPTINAYISIDAVLATVGNTNSALAIGAAQDTILLRDGAPNTLALRNGASAQTFNVYGTSSSSNTVYSRLAIACDTSGNATLTTQSTGTAGTVSINGVPVGLGKATAAQNALSLAIGVDTLAANTTGSNNIAIGHSALKTITTGAYNVGIGYEALSGATTSFESVAVGYQAGKGNVNRHVSIGYGADTVGPSADGVSIGWAAMYSVLGGSLNVSIGRNGGRFISGGSTQLTSGTKSLFLGCDTKALGQSQENQIVIGYDATGIGSNSVVLGNDSITKTALKGNVGIGTTAPGSALHISGALGSNITTYDSAAALKLTNTTGNSSWLLTSGVIGVVNASFSIRRDSVALPALTISGTDNVGIGTTAPATTLEVNGSLRITGVGQFGPTSTYYGLALFRVGTSTMAAQIYGDVNGLQFTSNGGADTVRILNSGNVGIGTTAPTANLVVTNSLGTGYTGTKVNIYGSVQSGGTFVDSVGNTIMASTLSVGGNGGGLDPTFNVYTGANNSRFLVTAGGNVGIGTTSPSSKLHVAGDVTLPNGGSIFFGGGFNIYGTTSGTLINGPTAFGQVSMSVNGVIKWLFNYDGLLCGGGTTAAFPALKRSSTTIQARLADDTAFAPIQGKLTTDTAYTGTVVAATGYITIYDSNGTAYRVPCAV